MLTELKATFLEEYAGARDEETKKRYKNATILYSKAMFALCDLLIYNRFRKLPKNHTERFKILEEHFPASYQVVDRLFEHYINAYNKPGSEKICLEMLEGIRRINEKEKLPEPIKEIIEKANP